jgi:hypothetical protein
MKAVAGSSWRSAPLALVVLLSLVPAANAQSASKPTLKGVTLDSGEVRDGIYKNFLLTYKIPFGWVDHTQQMRDSDSDPAKQQLLLAVFERPPEATGATVNSAIVIAAESVSSYPGLKTAGDYFGPLTELTTTKGFKVVNEPYAFAVGAKAMVRGDFSKELGKLTVHQSSLVMLQRGYIVSFNFIGGSEDEVEELIKNLSFAAAQKPATPRPKK